MTLTPLQLRAAVLARLDALEDAGITDRAPDSPG